MPLANQSSPTPAPNPARADVPEVFANTVHVEVGNTEMLLTFGTFENSIAQTGIRPSQRVILTHADFVGIANFLQTYVNFLNTAYGNVPRNLNQVPPEQFVEGLKHIGLAPTQQPERPQETSDETPGNQ